MNIHRDERNRAQAISRSFYEFGRPHTLAATSFQAFGVFTIVIAGGQFSLPAAIALLLAWAGSLAANLYVVGLNQLFDQDIDRINKPYLPLASGAISVRAGRGIVAAAGGVSLLIGILAGPDLLVTLAAVMLIGSLYSAPPLRLKARAGWAAFSISLARGLIANLGLYLYYNRVIAPPQVLPWGVVLLGLAFFFLFGVVIAIYKDIPDWAGDEIFRVRTFAVTLGRERVFQVGRWLLTGAYLLPVLGGVMLLPALGGIVLVSAHAVALFVFWARSTRTVPAQPQSVMALYRLLWLLFYAEYVFLAVCRWLSVPA